MGAKKRALIAATETDEYHCHVDGYLRTLDPHRELPDRDGLDRLVHVAHLSDTIFHYNWVDWFAAHGTPDDFTDLVAGLQKLSQDDMIPPVHATSDYHQMHTDTDRLFALSDAIRAAYDKGGGTDRMRQAMHARLSARMETLLAA